MEVDTEGGSEGREEEKKGGGGRMSRGQRAEEEESASTAGPRRKILEEGTTPEIPGPRNRISAKHIDLIYKTSSLMRNKWRGRELVLNHKTPALLRLR